MFTERIFVCDSDYHLQETRGKVGSCNVTSCVSLNTLKSANFDKVNTLLYSNAMQINMSKAISSSLIEVIWSLLNSVQVEIQKGVCKSNSQSILDIAVNMAMPDMSTNSIW